MKILITGTSSGIGRATALKFLGKGYDVIGIDVKPSTIEHDAWHWGDRPNTYRHIIADVLKPETLPELPDIAVIVNNAGTVEDAKSLSTNIEGYINVVEKYGYKPCTQSIVNIASISGHTGLDSARYAASQGARLAYTKHLAIELAKYGTRVNSISPGAVKTGLEPDLYDNEELMEAVASENLLHRWSTPEEIAEWVFFLAVIDTSMTGQDVVVDNGEMAKYNFVHV